MQKIAARKKKPLTFSYGLKSFLGYLEGTKKSAHTIKNYRSDLLSFQQFLEKGLGNEPVGLADMTQKDFASYHDYLKAQGFKTNTRRRKILTVRRLLVYLNKRKKLPLDVGKKIAAPHKVERVPDTVSYSELLAAIQKLPAFTLIEARNRALLWTLVETGCQVSEITRVRFEDWTPGYLTFGGKAPRSVPISHELYREIHMLKEKVENQIWLFLGFNKFGALGAPISPRGVELLVKSYCKRLGFESLTPRMIRHTVVLQWFREGASREEVQRRLGLKTHYAFRVYEPLLKSSVKTTSTS